MKYRWVKFKEFLCERCEIPLENTNGGGYITNDNGDAYCYECAYRLNLITKHEFSECAGYGAVGRLEGEEQIYAEHDW